MAEGMIRVTSGNVAAFQGANADRYISSAKLLAFLRDRAQSAEKYINEGRCADYAIYKQNVGARGELMKAIEYVEKLLKGKEDE